MSIIYPLNIFTSSKWFIICAYIHQPLGGFQGQSSDIQIHSNHILRTRQRLEEIYADCTGKTLEEVHAACDRDNYMVAEEALAFGLVDEIMDKNKLNG